MEKLTKWQKAIVVLTVLWEVFLLIDCQTHSMGGSGHIKWDDFFVLSMPFILYWSGVWIWGFGYIVAVFINIKNACLKRKKIIKAFFVLTFIAALFVSVYTPQKNTITAEDKELLYDYSVYYSLFVWQDQFCVSQGIELPNLKALRNQHSQEIDTLKNRVKNIKSIDDYVNSRKFYTLTDKKGKESFNYFRKIAILDKLRKSDPDTAMEFFKNLSKNDIFSKYGYMLDEKQTCEVFDNLIPEMMQDKENPFAKLIKMFDKYSFDFVPG